jgi:hypothetical protein
MANFTLSTEEIGRSPRRARIDRPADRDDNSPPVIYEALSDDGPFRRLTDAEAHRHIVFACFYYACLAVAVIAAMIWR